jgi:hypothetical protein
MVGQVHVWLQSRSEKSDFSTILAETGANGQFMAFFKHFDKNNQLLQLLTVDRKTSWTKVKEYFQHNTVGPISQLALNKLVLPG